ncbi:helix-turn-helix transcriptional regulator [Burkholderia thailandensis]|uniref:helix-turn-helix transcriptional regulator n=1 Tax=Burkholderia thailandensis TaxID=57975 RepID=UPI0021652D4B|nr:AlpA family phage regulatory protein [Burkholderia thailandensis]MCS3390381.1 AlpA family phage regulatory protein [Burkholderia thailandensis]
MQIQHDLLLRLPEVLARIPVSRATWYAGVKSGRYPQPVSLGPRCVAWRASDIQRLVTEGAQGAFSAD